MTTIQRHATVALLMMMIAAGTVRARQFSGWSAPVNLGPVVNSPFGDFFPTISKAALAVLRSVML